MNRHLLWLACAFVAPLLTAQTVLNPGANLVTAVNTAPPGATLALNPGTYTVSGQLVITKPLTLRPNVPGTVPVLQFPAGTIVPVDIKSSNVRVESVHITGGMWGVYAGGDTGYSNVTLKYLSITATTGQYSGHGIYARNLLNAVIDGNTVISAPVHGILVDVGCTNALVINNTVSGAGDQGIAIVSSDGVLVAGNTLGSVNQFGISINGSKYVRVERNNITSGVKQDGIVVTDRNGVYSNGVYVGRNVVTSTQYTAGNLAGTGIWLNNQSNGTLVYGNSTSGAPENGLTIFNTSNSWFWGNITTANGHGGIFLYDNSAESYSSGPAPSNNFIQGNYAHTLPFNAGINIHNATNTTVFQNVLRNTPAGFFLQQTSGNQIYLNILSGNTKGIDAMAGSTASRYFLNRHLTAMPNVAAPGTSVSFDGGPGFGGNYQVGGKVLSDAYPYNVESLGRAAFVSVVFPASGTVAGVGTRKTIEWRSSACTTVDIFYNSGASGQQSIVADYPDTGIYHWTVPSLPAGSDYRIQVVCNNFAGAPIGASGTSAAFSVAPAGVELLAPQGNHRITGGASTKVAWKRNAGVTGAVTVQYRSTANGGLTTLATNVLDNEVDVTVPATGTSHGQFVITVAGSSASDSTDGWVSVRDTTPTVSGPSGTIAAGTLQGVRWQSHQSSYYVDLEYWDSTASTYRSLATNLPDFGRYNFLVPDRTLSNSHLRVVFKNVNLGAIATATSETFNTASSGSGGGGTSPAAPAVGTISPASGSGLTQTFTVTYTDPNGASDIGSTYLMINNVIDGVSACFIEYNRLSNTYRLLNEGGNEWSAPVTAGSGSRSNARCTINGAGGGSTVSGNTLTVTYPVTFAQLEPANRNTYSIAFDTANMNSGWKTVGSWTIPGAQPARPDVVSLTPAAGSGISGTFTAVFRHPNGPTGHSLGYILFLPTPNVVSFQAQGSCLIEYNRISNAIRLIDDPGTGWQGPIPIAPAAAPLTNNACTVNVSGATAAFSGTDMIVTVPVTFKPAGVTTVLGTFLQENDMFGNWTDFRQFGNWVVPGATTRPGISVVGAGPTSGVGSSMTLNTTVSHTGGASQINEIHVRFNTAIVGGAPCHAVYYPPSNTILLVNDAQTGIVGPAPLGTTLSSGSRCTVTGGSRTVAGNLITLSLPFTFSPASFAGTKNVYIVGFGASGGVTHWVQTGTWTVQ